MTNVDHEALEELLRHAPPRPMPGKDDEAAVRNAVRQEWRDLTGRRQKRRRIAQYAMAATVLVGVFAAFSAFRGPAVDAVQVATIERNIGPVYLLGEEAELRDTVDLANIMSGQIIVTGAGAGLSVAWGSGGSIRVDENSRVEFSDSQSVFLESGRVYFDSQSVPLVAGIDAGGAPGVTLRTEYGDIEHLGTQYMTEVDAGRLVVSVREGQVAIEGTYHDHLASPGQQVTMTGSAQPSVLSISTHGEAWSWVNRTTPTADFEGKSLYEFLAWVSREMGLELAFEGQAEASAHDAILIGRIDMEPAEALRLRLATAGYDWRIDEGVIYISDNR